MPGRGKCLLDFGNVGVRLDPSTGTHTGGLLIPVRSNEGASEAATAAYGPGGSIFRASLLDVSATRHFKRGHVTILHRRGEIWLGSLPTGVIPGMSRNLGNRCYG